MDSAAEILAAAGIAEAAAGGARRITTPIDGSEIAALEETGDAALAAMIARADQHHD